MSDGPKGDEEPTGKARGGIARAGALSPEQRHSIARKAAAARWGLKTTHKGNFKEHFGFDVDCYVLNDEQKTAVISQRGMGETLGLGKGGSRLPAFLDGQKIAPFVGTELAQKMANPLVFQQSVVGRNQPPMTVNGYDATILIDICKAVIAAADAGKLLKSQEHIVKQAHVIVGASAKFGITDLVYALAGYDATREERIAAFKLYVSEEAQAYEKEFPPELYEEWYRLYQLPRPEKNKPWKMMHLTVGQVYWPLARSSGRILGLVRAQKAKKADRHEKLYRFLSEIGVKALRTHLGKLLGIALVSDDRAQYEQRVEKVFGTQTSFDFGKRATSPSAPSPQP